MSVKVDFQLAAGRGTLLIARRLYQRSGIRNEFLENGRALSEPLHLHMIHGGTASSGSGSDRAVRRKPVVGSGQDVWGYGFSIAQMIGVADEKRCR
jgi:hypothetical protein